MDHPGAVEIRRQLEAAVAPDRRAQLAALGRLAAARGWPVYVVGGFVRDLLLGFAPDDCDLVVEGPAPALARAAAAEWGGAVRAHAPFGTATWSPPDGGDLDFATARTETYPQPAALPVVQVPAPLRADLDRRDFSINAIALRLDGEHFGELIDPHAGRSDLAARRVRVLHPRSFQDDPTRLFRAVRYEQRLGFAITPETLALIPGAWDALDALSPDRARHEFELIFREARASAMLARLDALGALARVHPALAWGAAETAEAAFDAEAPWAEWGLERDPDGVYFALLLRRSGEAGAADALARLNVSRAVGQAAQAALGLRRTWSRPSEAVAVLDDLSLPGVAAACVARPELRGDLRAYLSRWRFVRAATTGRDLIARGLTPGPDFKDLLWSLRAARLDGEIADAEGEAAWLAQRLAAPDRP